MRYCLIIDDTDQSDEIFLLEAKAKEKAFPIKCYFFNPSKRECQREEKKSDGSIEYVLDLDLILNELNQEKYGQIDLIATDYRLSDNTITGLDIVKHLKSKNWRGKTPYVIFSSDSDDITKNLQAKIIELIDDKDKLKDFLENYFDTNPNKIFPRKKNKGGIEIPYTDYIYEYIKTNKTSLNQKLHQKLKQQPEHRFNNIFPGFEGQKLENLSKLILDNSVESDRFEDEFIDRSVDHFIYLKD